MYVGKKSPEKWLILFKLSTISTVGTRNKANEDKKTLWLLCRVTWLGKTAQQQHYNSTYFNFIFNVASCLLNTNFNPSGSRGGCTMGEARSTQVIRGSYMNICGFGTLLMGTSAVLPENFW